MRELGSLTRHQAAALIGVAPLNHDSGARRGYRAIHARCAPCLRRGKLLLERHWA